MDKMIKAQIILPLFLIAAGLLAAKMVNFKLVLKPSEARVAGFSYEAPVLPETKSIEVSSLNSLIEIMKPQKKDFPPEPLSKIVPQGPEQAASRVSMIVLSEGRRMAVVNGIVLREGDLINKMTLSKIEKHRVLLSDPATKINTWVNLEVK